MELELTALGSGIVLLLVQFFKAQTNWSSRGKSFAMLGAAFAVALIQVLVASFSEGVDWSDAEVVTNRFVLIAGTTQTIYVLLKTGVQQARTTFTTLLM